MLSINTNLAGLIAQNSMKTSTDKLNQAIERMTTGLKINHASDNAANYSISTNLTTQLSAYDTAADNVAMGMDLVNYASDIISQMQDKAARLNALSTQARNGTYGAQSLSALNSEASAIMSEIMRLYNTAEYNDISLFNRTAYTIAPHLPKAGASGFIDETALISMAAAGDGAGIAAGEVVGTTTDAPKAKAEYNGFIENPVTYTDEQVALMTPLTDSVTTLSTTTKYSISSVDELENLAELVNSGIDTTGVEFVLGSDIDLSSISNWNPIGDYTISPATFKGSFDGNGHIIKNLKIDRETSNYQGLFGKAESGEIKNIGLENVNVKGQNNVGGLVGTSSSQISNSYAGGNVNGFGDYIGGLVGVSTTSSSIDNCYSVVNVVGTANTVGGLVGQASSTISNSYATGTISGAGSKIGGLAGYSTSSISNSYATGAVNGTGDNVGGLVGYSTSSISNSYSTGNVSGLGKYVGGFIGATSSTSSINNSYSTGNVSGSGTHVGGFVGLSQNSITNCYATGDVTGQNYYVGGLVGASPSSSITNSYASGNVNGGGIYVGGLVGSITSSTMSYCYAIGKVNGKERVGGLAGYSTSSISNSYATGAVNGTGDNVGGLVGQSSSSISNSYATGAVSGTNNNVGGLVGASSSSSITNSYASGNVNGGGMYVGGLVGDVNTSSSIINSYATGNIIGHNDNVGGLAGRSYNSTIINSYATGNVSGTGNNVGGLAGYVTSTITNSYATGNVSGTGNNVGGLAGYATSSITNSYATGNISGQKQVGGLVGQIYATSGTREVTNSLSYSTVAGTDFTSTGSLIGGAVMTSNGTSFGTLNITNTQSIAQDGMNSIGGTYHSNGTAITYDLSPMLAGITDVAINKTSTDLQVGIYSNSSSQLNFDTNFSFDLNIDSGIESVEAFNAIVAFEKLLSEKATQLGAVQNRLDSALESIEVNINNLTSTRSTIRDADIAEVSSHYIQQQILQQASATLMATANQAPAIALQLI